MDYETTCNRLENVEVGDKIDIRDTEFIWC